jgi:hypothetical protein
VLFAAHPEITQRARALMADAALQDLSPWENLIVPEEFDGSRGTFRAPRLTWALAGVNYPSLRVCGADAMNRLCL